MGQEIGVMGNTDNARLAFKLSTTIIILFITLAVLIICSNMTVIITAIYDKRLQRLRYIPLISLSVADLLMVVPIVLLVIANFYIQNSELLKTVFTLITFCFVAAVMNLVAVSIERWVAIFRPLQYGAFLKNRNIAGLVSGAWVLAFLAALPTLTFKDFKIFYHPKDVGGFEKIYLLTMASTFFLVCLIIGFMQFQIMLLVRKHINKVGPVVEVSVTEASTSSVETRIPIAITQTRLTYNLSIPSRKDFRRREFATAVAVNIMYLSVVFTWPPCVIMLFVTLTKKKCDTCCLQGMQVALFFVFLNCLINPVIYTIRIRHFKFAILRMLSCIPCCRCLRSFRKNSDDLINRDRTRLASIISRTDVRDFSAVR